MCHRNEALRSRTALESNLGHSPCPCSPCFWACLTSLPGSAGPIALSDESCQSLCKLRAIRHACVAVASWAAGLVKIACAPHPHEHSSIHQSPCPPQNFHGAGMLPVGAARLESLWQQASDSSCQGVRVAVSRSHMQHVYPHASSPIHQQAWTPQNSHIK